MFVYIAICLSLLFPLYLQRRSERLGIHVRTAPLLIACTILAAFFSLRASSVGVDTKFYCYAFAQFRNISYRDLFRARVFATAANTWTINLEPGYRILNKLLSELTTNPQEITIVNGILLFVFLFLFIRVSSDDPMMSIWLFVTLGFFQSDMNVTRNAIAVFLCFCAFRWIREGRFLRYLLIVALASLIHQTALMFIPLYFLIRYVAMNRRRAAVLFALFLVLGLSMSFFQSRIISVLPYRYARYFLSGNEKLVSNLVGLFNAFVVLFTLSFTNHEERVDLEQSWQFDEGIWMLVLNVCFFAMSFGFSAASRAAALFSPYVIVFIPNILRAVRSERQRTFGCFAVAAICFLQFVLRLMVNNIGGSIPYRFFWQ